MSSFPFKLYVERYKSHITYSLAKTDEGWHLQHIAHSGPTKPDGSPLLVANFEQDGVHYPVGIDGFLEYVWKSLHRGEISEQDAADKIQQVANWVSTCEQNQPRWAGWNC